MLFGKKTSIISRVTLWYSSFILILITLLLGSIFVVSGSFVDMKNKQELEKSAREMSYDKGDYEFFDDGIYYSLYKSDNSLNKRSFPLGFKTDLPYNKSQIKEYSYKGKTYYYFDVKMKGEDLWLRAVMKKDTLDDEAGSFVLTVFLASPFILAVVVIGGYTILKRAFRPITLMSQTAHAIEVEQDFSRRIELGNREDELHRLGQSFNQMLASIEASFEREKQLSNDVSHELRTPVAVILSESEYGLSYADDLEEARESHAIVNRQAKRMKEMIEQIMTLSRMDSQTKLDLLSLDLTKLLKTNLEQYDKLCAQKGIRLTYHLQEDCQVMGDEILLTRVLDNLLSNAMKFTKSEIKLILEQKADKVYFSVEDNGLGISQDNQDKIWQRFYQVDDARQKTDQAGSGLGLSLVKKIVDLHNGRVELSSKEGQGSCFKVILPTI